MVRVFIGVKAKLDKEVEVYFTQKMESYAADGTVDRWDAPISDPKLEAKAIYLRSSYNNCNA